MSQKCLHCDIMEMINDRVPQGLRSPETLRSLAWVAGDVIKACPHGDAEKARMLGAIFGEITARTGLKIKIVALNNSISKSNESVH
ncbi:MAG: hypothetical protein DCC73_11835 [Proteobacteria bacterium]|nr:MAG: hypothetical protein DCC73_11835 [Pseudomonadota bacterium]